MRNAKTRILIVDDEESYTTLLKLNLEKTGRYDVTCENRSSHACEAALEVLPDIILLDVVMPEADGGDVAFALQQHARLKNIPIIFVTALVDSATSEGHLVNTESGEEVLGKPFRLDTLCQCIDERVLTAPAR